MNYLLKVRHILLLVILLCAQVVAAQSIEFIEKASKDPGYVKASGEDIAYKDRVPKPTAFVNDYEGLFKDAEEKELNGIIANFEHKTSIEIVVVTVKPSMATLDELDNYAIKMAQTWGVGKAAKDNGILVLLSLGHRTLIMKGGQGVRSMLDNNKANEIINIKATPKLKKGEYYNGIKDSVLALMEQFKE